MIVSYSPKYFYLILHTEYHIELLYDTQYICTTKPIIENTVLF